MKRSSVPALLSLLLCLFTVPAMATVTLKQIEWPRSFGYRIGDTVPVRLTLEVAPGWTPDRDGLPEGVVKVLRPALRFALHGVDIREVGCASVLTNNPEPRTAPAGPGIQPPLEMGDLARPLRRLTDSIEHRVIPLD